MEDDTGRTYGPEMTQEVHPKSKAADVASACEADQGGLLRVSVDLRLQVVKPGQASQGEEVFDVAPGIALVSTRAQMPQAIPRPPTPALDDTLAARSDDVEMDDLSESLNDPMRVNSETPPAGPHSADRASPSYGQSSEDMEDDSNPRQNTTSDSNSEPVDQSWISTTCLNESGVFARGQLMPWSFYILDPEEHKMPLVMITVRPAAPILSWPERSMPLTGSGCWRGNDDYCDTRLYPRHTRFEATSSHTPETCRCDLRRYTFTASHLGGLGHRLYRGKHPAPAGIVPHYGWGSC